MSVRCDMKLKTLVIRRENGRRFMIIEYIYILFRYIDADMSACRKIVD